MSEIKIHSWNILCLGQADTRIEKAEKHLHDIGYPNAKLFPLKNEQSSDDKLIELLKQGDWDGVSIGGGINGYDENYPRNRATLHWFNRLINLIKENAPRAKIIFVDSPADLADSFERVLGCQEKPLEAA